MANSSWLGDFRLDTNLFQFLIPDMYNKYGPYKYVNLNFSAYDTPEFVITNVDFYDGPNIAIKLPLNLHMHVVTDNETNAHEEAFWLRTKLDLNISVANTQDKDGKDQLAINLKNSSQFIDYSVVQK